ncbi:HlyD family secretion protein [Salinimonas marina]|uniref:HlyD family secretion protein n=1 Tax=Salinimonas marina TaxID=2785918 RepID=A0A7S9DXP2_9ALTE|nr:HlyD family secretion protein [Salinimonas marina]QPG05760.1 HlyD family secretion protein [Salinimonas marina]
MGTVVRILVTLLVVALAVFAGRWVWDNYLYSPWTRDGRVRADITVIAPDVSGWVTRLAVRDNQSVEQGEVLFTIDDARYQAAIEEQQAVIDHKYRMWELAQSQYQQQQQSEGQDQSLGETSRISAEVAKADYNEAVAKLNTLELNLERTTVKAPQTGSVVNLDLREGNYVQQGSPVLSIVKQGSFFVTGYFEETKLPLVHVGQRATVKLMSSEHTLTGKVVSIGQAIANTSVGHNEQMLPKIQQTFNWVRLAQRIPVDIELDPVPEQVRLVAGTTVSVHLNKP